MLKEDSSIDLFDTRMEFLREVRADMDKSDWDDSDWNNSDWDNSDLFYTWFGHQERTYPEHFSEISIITIEDQM